MDEEKDRLGKMLVDAGLLTEEQLKMGIDFQKSVGGKLGAVITKLGFIEDQTLTNFIARQQGIPVTNVEELVIPANLVKRLPRKLIEKHHVLPIHFKDDVLTVVTSDPFDYEAIEEIQLAVDSRVEVQLGSRSGILKVIHELFYKEPAHAPVKEKSKEQLLKDLEHPLARVPRERQLEALIPLLISKGVITEDELARKIREQER